MGAQLKGIDVSHWNGKIDWAKVKADGVKFAFLKAAQGSKSGRIYPDRCFAEYLKGATAAGVPVGVYLYSMATTVDAARTEAENLVALLSTSRDLITWPVAYDIEDTKTQALETRRTLNTQQAIAFCDVIRNAGYIPMLYTNPGWAFSYIDVKAVGVDVWLANYTGRDFGIEHTIHQHTDQGRVNGIKTNVDMNVAYKDYGEVTRYMKRYNTLAECPLWARPTIQKLIAHGLLRGDGTGFNLSEDMIRMLVINDRAGLYDIATGAEK